MQQDMIDKVTVGNVDYILEDARATSMLNGDLAVGKAITHEAINIRGKNLNINDLTDTSFGKIYTGIGNEWADSKNLPKGALDAKFCLKVLPSGTDTVHRYTFILNSAPQTVERSFSGNSWSTWKFTEGGWKGTKEQFEKEKNTLADNQLIYITDDGGNDPLFVSNEVKQGELTPVTSNAVYDYVSKTIYQKLFDIVMPVGKEVVQLPKEADPNVLYNQGGITSQWDDITAEVDQDFLKFDNGKQIGTPEVAGLPNITGGFSVPTYSSGNSFVATSYCFSTKPEGNKSSLSFADIKIGTGVGFDASKTSGAGANIYGKSTTVTPQNKSVKLWKRIK